MTQVGHVDSDVCSTTGLGDIRPDLGTLHLHSNTLWVELRQYVCKVVYVRVGMEMV